MFLHHIQLYSGITLESWIFIAEAGEEEGSFYSQFLNRCLKSPEQGREAITVDESCLCLCILSN